MRPRSKAPVRTYASQIRRLLSSSYSHGISSGLYRYGRVCSDLPRKIIGVDSKRRVIIHDTMGRCSPIRAGGRGLLSIPAAQLQEINNHTTASQPQSRPRPTTVTTATDGNANADSLRPVLRHARRFGEPRGLPASVPARSLPRCKASLSPRSKRLHLPESQRDTRVVHRCQCFAFRPGTTPECEDTLAADSSGHPRAQRARTSSAQHLHLHLVDGGDIAQLPEAAPLRRQDPRGDTD